MKFGSVYFRIEALFLMVVLLVTFLFAKSHHYAPQETCIQLYVQRSDGENSISLIDVPLKRNYLRVDLDGDKLTIEENLKLVENLAHSLQQNKDTLQGIKLIFGKELKYKYFVESINCCLKAKISNYVPFGDSLFIYYSKRGTIELEDSSANFPVFDKIHMFEM